VAAPVRYPTAIDLAGSAAKVRSTVAGRLIFQAWKVYYVPMKKSTSKRHGGARPGSGRPKTGRDPIRAVRISDDLINKVAAWAATQDDNPNRSEAIRRLVELGLKAKGK
jgi:hypothetical protein